MHAKKSGIWDKEMCIHLYEVAYHNRSNPFQTV